MDPGVVKVLHDAFKEALFDPANAAVRANFDMPLEYYGTEDYRDFVVRRAEYERAMAQRLNCASTDAGTASGERHGMTLFTRRGALGLGPAPRACSLRRRSARASFPTGRSAS
jgi:hypothetical protein